MDKNSWNVGSSALRVTIADRFEEARALFSREKVPLPVLRRRSRRNDFVKTLDAVAGQPE